jgi:hypothetical protein
MHLLIGFGIVFGLMSLILGPRGAALVVAWVVVSVICVGPILNLGFGFNLGGGAILVVMGIILALYLAARAPRSMNINEWHGRENDDDAILREAVRRAQRDEEDRERNMAVLRKHFADEMEVRLRRDG